MLTWNGWDEPNIWILRRQLDAERFIVKASSGPRYVVTCKVKLDKSKLVSGSRVSLDMTTLTIMRLLPREVEMMLMMMLGFFFGGGWKKINDILVKYWDEMQLKELLVDKIQVTTWYGKTMDKWSETYELQQLGYALVFASPLLRNPSNVQWITPHQLWSILSDCCLPSTSIFLDIFIIV